MLTSRNGGHVRRLRVQVASLAKIPMDLSSGKVRHGIRDEKFGGLFVVPIAIDEQLDAGCLVLSDQVDGLGHRTDIAVRRFASRRPLALRRHFGVIAGEKPSPDMSLFDRVVIATRLVAMAAQHIELMLDLDRFAAGDIAGVG
jgi:hypothetical protein